MCLAAVAYDRKSMLPEEFFDRVFCLRGKIFDIALQQHRFFPSVWRFVFREAPADPFAPLPQFPPALPKISVKFMVSQILISFRYWGISAGPAGPLFHRRRPTASFPSRSQVFGKLQTPVRFRCMTTSVFIPLCLPFSAIWRTIDVAMPLRA